MGSWDETLRGLREQFFQGSGGRLDRIAACLRQLEAQPGDASALEGLRLEFHAFSGLGGSYGMPRLTTLGFEGERLCDAWAAVNGGPTGAQRTTGLALLDALRQELAAAGGASLPAASAAATPPEPGEPAPADILVVDDDPALRKVLRVRLEQEGMRVREAATMAAAIGEIGRRVPDGALVDIRLPDGTGYEVVENLRATLGGEAAAVLVLSADTELMDRVQAIHCGADGYFAKPLDGDALLRRLQFLLARAHVAPARVLSVEDDPDQAAFVRAALDSVGYEVRICPDGSGFLRDVAAFQPDLVLMDVHLPGGATGYDLARLLRQDEQHAALPVVFLTTHGELTARMEAARSGGDDHLVKPVAAGLLLATVAARLERARFLRGLLQHDGLTQLLSHTAFLERLKAATVRIRRNPSRGAAFVMVDLDHFKTVNDRFGHPTGDRVLAALAAALRRRLRQSDTIGRLGGEEFAVLLEDLSAAEAVRLVEMLLAEFSAVDHAGPGGEPFRVTFSAGIAMFDGSPDWRLWQAAADRALYAAKAAGRNRVVVAS